MLTYEVSYNLCDACFSTSNLLERVNKALYLLGGRVYKNRVLLAGKTIDTEKIKLLGYYKDILENLIYNPYYYQGFDYQRIDSRVKELINGLH